MPSTTASPASQPTVRTILFSQAPSPSLAVSVIVPVRNEAHNLQKTLDALRQQQQPDGTPLAGDSYEVLLLANNCTDQSYQFVMAYKLTHPDFALRVAEIQFPVREAHIGTARRLLMDEACNRFQLLGNQKGIIASTDGDTEVDRCWVYYLTEEFKKGIDAVGGRIIVNNTGTPCHYHSLDETYRTLITRVESILDPLEHDCWPRHYQYFGANLAVTCEMYQLAGRLPRLPHLEDEAFHRALMRKDARIRRSPAVKVLTSSRHEGRVKIGLSEQLRKWAQMKEVQEPQMVRPAAEIIARVKARRTVRDCWKEAESYGAYHAARLSTAAEKLLLSPRWVKQELEQTLFFGQLWDAIEQKLHTGPWSRQWKPALITTAIRELTEFVQEER